MPENDDYEWPALPSTKGAPVNDPRATRGVSAGRVCWTALDEAQPEAHCPTCGPTTIETHPSPFKASAGIVRCTNCKEWIACLWALRGFVACGPARQNFLWCRVCKDATNTLLAIRRWQDRFETLLLEAEAERLVGPERGH